MKHLSDVDKFRAHELLELRATVGLEPAEEQELAALGVANDESFDLAAASISLASLEIETMPAHLSNQLMMSVSGTDVAGGADVAGSSDTTVMPAAMPPTQIGMAVPAHLVGLVRSASQSVPPPNASIAVPPVAWQNYPSSGEHSTAGLAQRPTTLPPGAWIGQPPPAPSVQPPPPAQPNVVSLDAARLRRRARVATTFAVLGMAAAAAVAVFFVTRPPVVKEITRVERIEVPVTPPAVNEPTPAEARAALLKDAKDVTTLAWSATEDPSAKGASGDVVWSAEKQKGFMRIAGLAVNDAKQLQYQLWIFDANRPEETPVDGGVFDISANGEVIVPIDARIPVDKATLFAVTVERPGGVVVSKRERIVLAAKVAG